jgi:hypothetical protein
MQKKQDIILLYVELIKMLVKLNILNFNLTNIILLILLDNFVFLILYIYKYEEFTFIY